MKIQLKHFLETFTGIQTFRNSLPRGVNLSKDIMRIHPYELEEIWDIGAHKGETTLKFAEDFPTALIRSFEPVSENYYSLRNNCSHLKNQSSHNMALGEKIQKTKIFLQGASVIHSLRDDLNKPSAEDSKSEDIEVKTIDYVINEFKTASIDLLKIDVEG